MSSRLFASVSASMVLLFCAATVSHAQTPLRRVRESADSRRAVVRVHADQPSAFSIPREITGKFAEHLGFNIYNGMDAQILHNATFADYPIWNGRMSPDGVTTFRVDETKITEEIRELAGRFGWPETEWNGLIRARTDGLAAFWTRQGGPDDVQVSPEAGPFGGRAQRIQVKAASQGIAQWTWLPLHRQHRYEFQLLVRSPQDLTLTVALWSKGGEKPVASALVAGVSDRWQKLRGDLTVPLDLPNDVPYKIVIAAKGPAQFVIGHSFLWPADHVNGADPDVIRFLKQSHLPLLRWPGGNFVSTYHWEDGIGPVEQRPTKPNYAWGAVEPNTFGTDEFISFCRAVGCEPMICINAGGGTPEEAARWIEYCNGPATSPMGRLRAANGHSEPYGVQRWEVGNELWGHWQMYWTTASGYVDRFKRFSTAMRAADPSISLYACGAPAMSGKLWNDTLIAGAGSMLTAITDHPLIGGGVSPAAEPTDVFRDFMAVPEILEEKWAALRHDMIAGQVAHPKLAVTELQLFAHVGSRTDTNAPIRLRYETLPGQGSITEALYDVLVYHAAVRELPFLELITHSAVVNHGGGLRKERERVWANPCYYAQASFSAFAETTPVPIEIAAPGETAPMVLPDLQRAAKTVTCSGVDALAARDKNGTLWLSVVNRDTSPEGLHLTIELEGFQPADTVQVWTLKADAPWEGNTREHPESIQPVDSTLAIENGKIELDVRPYSVLRLRVAGAR